MKLKKFNKKLKKALSMYPAFSVTSLGGDIWSVSYVYGSMNRNNCMALENVPDYIMKEGGKIYDTEKAFYDPNLFRDMSKYS